MLQTQQIDLVDMGQRAKKAARALVKLTTEQKNQALIAMAEAWTLIVSAFCRRTRWT